jgi:hypothetical protein
MILAHDLDVMPGGKSPAFAETTRREQANSKAFREQLEKLLNETGN